MQKLFEYTKISQCVSPPSLQNLSLSIHTPTNLYVNTLNADFQTPNKQTLAHKEKH